jgi:hypothetical protein
VSLTRNQLEAGIKHHFIPENRSLKNLRRMPLVMVRISRRNAEYVARMKEVLIFNSFQSEDFKTNAAKQLRRMNSIEIDFKGMGCEEINWINLTQDRIQWQALVTQ